MSQSSGALESVKSCIANDLYMIALYCSIHKQTKKLHNNENKKDKRVSFIADL